MPGRVQRDPALGVAEEVAVGLETERDELVEDERVAESLLGDVRPDRRVGREARHQGHRDP